MAQAIENQRHSIEQPPYGWEHPLTEQLKAKLKERGITPSRLDKICIIEELPERIESKILEAGYFESQRKRLQEILLKYGVTKGRFIEIRTIAEAIRQDRPPGKIVDDESYSNAGLTLREMEVEVWAHHIGVEILESTQRGDIKQEEADYYGEVFNPHLIKPEQQAVPLTST
ncbi:MAG: hypothetical protein Q8P89_02340 [bacterium]|nr:hypothetical protein [bacterium]